MKRFPNNDVLLPRIACQGPATSFLARLSRTAMQQICGGTGKPRMAALMLATAAAMALPVPTFTSVAEAQSNSSGAKVTITEFSVETLTSDAERQAAESADAQAADNDAGQVDLLSVVTDNTTETSATITAEEEEETDGRSISSIDEAVSLITVDTSQTQSNAAPSPDAQAQGDVTIDTDAGADQRVDGGVTGAETAAETAPLAGTPADGAADPSIASTDDRDTEDDTSRVSLVRTSVPYTGVADVGAEPSADSSLTRVIWRGTTAAALMGLADANYANGGSPALAALAGDVMAIRAEPPAEIDGQDSAFVMARLAWLGAAGRSQDIGKLVSGLPNDPDWLEWKKWQVTTQLSEMRDDEACRSVMYFAGQTLEPFWHKAKVICSAVQGDATGARFAADLLQAMGQDDPVFRALVDLLLDGIDVPEIDPALLEPLHIVLMEAAHHPIGIGGLDAMPAASLQSVTSLLHLEDEARLIRAYRALQGGFLTHQDVAKQWRLAAVDAGDMSMALARHESMPTALTRALLWRALDNEKTASRLVMIAAAMDVDAAEGAGMLMAPLYAELAREALGFKGVETLLSDAGAPLAAKIALLLAAASNSADAGPSGADLFGAGSVMPAGLDTAIFDALAGVSSMMAGGPMDSAALDQLDIWHLLPLFERRVGADAATAMPVNWLSLDSAAARAPASFVSISPVWMRALEQAADDRRVGETVLIAQRIVSAQGLSQLHPADAARIHAALMTIGQTAVANAVANDILSAHLLDASLAIDIDNLPLLEMAATASGEGVASGDTVAATEATTNDDFVDASQTEAGDAGSQDSDN